jgi:energy-converting hydrogenase Eha subunit H
VCGDADVGNGSAAVGVAAIFDFNDLWRLVGSANTGICNAAADQFSFNFALKWTP